MILCRADPPRPGRPDPRRHPAAHPRAVPARAVDPLRAPVRPARLGGHPAGPAEDPRDAQPVHATSSGSIISIDTLKNVGRYRHHLEAIRWDAVVIDESHNVVNDATLNNQLARVLAPRRRRVDPDVSARRTTARAEEFADLIDLLDPTAVADPKHFGHDEIKHLSSAATRQPRSPPRSAPTGPSACRRELSMVPAVAGGERRRRRARRRLAAPGIGRHRSPRDAASGAPGSSPGRSLKAFLSSHAPCSRRSRTAAPARQGESPTRTRAIGSDDALGRPRRARRRRSRHESASKFAALAATLRDIGVGPRSDTRVVIFSERIATLDLARRPAPRRPRSWATRQVEILHGGLTDNEQQEIVEQFGQAEAPVRVLVTGDVASEGVNLHRAVPPPDPLRPPVEPDPHRAAQRPHRPVRPDVTARDHALLLEPTTTAFRATSASCTELLEKEHEAHTGLGDTASLMGQYDGTGGGGAPSSRGLAGRAPDSPRSSQMQPDIGFDLCR